MKRLLTFLWGNPEASHYRRRRGKRSNRANHAARMKRIDSTLKSWRDKPRVSERGSIPDQMPFIRAPHLLSKGERALWHPLYHAVKGRYRLFCKVRLADVVKVQGTVWDDRRWFRRIRGYHVDFVICDPETTMPIIVVELDDKWHRSMKVRADRDDFKDAVLRAAGVPIYRVRAQQAYDPLQIAEDIRRLAKAVGEKST